MKDFFKIRQRMVKEARKNGANIDDRMTGKSTAIALMTIADAINNPKQWVEIVDHHHSKAAQDCLNRAIKDILESLELEGFYFRRGSLMFQGCDLDLDNAKRLT